MDFISIPSILILAHFVDLSAVGFRRSAGGGTSRLIGHRLFRPMVALAAVALVALSATLPERALAQERVALVIGNARYQAGLELRTPVADANLVSNALRKAGFRTTVATNLNKAAVERALYDFQREARTAEAAIVYYAGHGIEMSGVNYLIPIDSHLVRYGDVPAETVSLDSVIAATHGARLRLIAVDASRTPLSGQASLTRSLAGGTGGRAEPEENALIVFSSAAGAAAIDGKTNSPFAESFARRIVERGSELALVLRRISDDVNRATAGQQKPMVVGRIDSPAFFFLGEDGRPPAAPAVTAALSATQPAQQRPVGTGKRLALVIGNQRYGANLGALANPISDGKLITDALENAGFTVEFVKDADWKTMRRAVTRFSERLAGLGAEGVGLFYFAGHGAQYLNESYLIPVDADVTSDSDLPIEGFSAPAVLETMQGAGAGLNIIILDACRNLPIRRSTRGGIRGLARMEGGSGSVIAYSTRPGATAEDGDGANSIYASALAAEIRKPGQEIEAAFRNVNAAVEAATNGRQQPRQDFSLTKRFLFTESPALR